MRTCMVTDGILLASLDTLGFIVKVSFCKTVQSPSILLVEPRKDMNDVGWLVGSGYNATVISWRSVTHIVSRLSHTSTNTTFFPKPQTTFPECFSRGERREYAGKKVCLNCVSNSQPAGHEYETLTTEPPGQSHE